MLVKVRITPFVHGGTSFTASNKTRFFRASSVFRKAPITCGSERIAIKVQHVHLNLQKDLKTVPVLNDCCMSIPEGQLWMLLGPNGCGKSTLLKLLAGLLKPTSGMLSIDGPKSFVFQNPDHQVVMPTAEADVAFGLGRFDLPEEVVRDRVMKSLEAVGMAELYQRPVQTLSGGQKQRVAIAGALAENSKVLLLDELTTFLDEGDQMGVIQAVRRVVSASHGVTALWVTHRLEELDFADGALYMENGAVILSGQIDIVKEFIFKKQADYKKSIALNWRSLFLGKLPKKTLSLSGILASSLTRFVFNRPLAG